MIRLSEPLHTFGQSLDDCVAGMATHMGLRARLVDGTVGLVAAGDEYEEAARRGRLVEIAPFRGEASNVVLEGLTKEDLLKVYHQYFVPEKKVARRIYNALLSAALDRCPFCGGIGTPRNLDHFLPKGLFPQFSVLPRNLVPACRDCNMDGKGSAYPETAEAQALHPYFEDAKFFEKQWVFATYRVGDQGAPGVFDYFVRAPIDWEEVDKRRAQNHFDSFDLAKRYSIKAAEHLGMVLAQMSSIRAIGVSEEALMSTVIQSGIDTAPFANHWRRGMYQALQDAA